MKATWQIRDFPVRVSNSTVILFSPCFVSPTLFILLGRSQVILQGFWKTVALCPDVPHLHLLLPRGNNFQCFKRLFLVLKLIVVNDKLKQQLTDFSLSRQCLSASYQEDVGLTLFHPSHNHQPPATPTPWKPTQIYLHGLHVASSVSCGSVFRLSITVMKWSLFFSYVAFCFPWS